MESNGVISQLTKVLVGLYEEPERPANAIDYIKKYLGAPTGIIFYEIKKPTNLQPTNTINYFIAIDIKINYLHYFFCKLLL